MGLEKWGARSPLASTAIQSRSLVSPRGVTVASGTATPLADLSG